MQQDSSNVAASKIWDRSESRRGDRREELLVRYSVHPRQTAPPPGSERSGKVAKKTATQPCGVLLPFAVPPALTEAGISREDVGW